MPYPNACCNEPANLAVLPEDQSPDRADLVVRRCQVCLCRHFEATADPGMFGLRGAPLEG